MERVEIRLEELNVYDSGVSAHIDYLLPEYLKRKRIEASRTLSKKRRPAVGILAHTQDVAQKKSPTKAK